MKNIYLKALVVSLIVAFSSCTNEEPFIPEEQSIDLLKTYSLKRDASGAYSLDYSLNGNVSVDNVKDLTTKTNKIYLYSSEYQEEKNRSQGVLVEGNKLNIGFVDTNSDKTPSITVIDDNITLARSAKNKEKNYLKDYTVTNNGDGSYTLNFKVKNKVKVHFVYNDNDDVYEIHLEKKNKKRETEFERTFFKEEGKKLTIAFVNHYEGDAFREAKVAERKPVVIIDDGEEGDK